MSEPRSRRPLLLGVVAVLLVVTFVPPWVSLNRFRGSIAAAIGGALGRQVTASEVSLRLIPRPGIHLTNLVIHEDPAFGAEPMLRAEEVTATLRISSLWRGRLEIGSLSLKYPSLNLVRLPDGQWNLQDLLLRATHIPSAPTTKSRPEQRPRFPYIEAEDGRINFKAGNQKTVYALTDSDFALWLASEGEWKMRLEARPVRTDSNLSDTGVIKVNGTFRRATRLRQTPMRVRVELERAQLGQLTTLVSGRDRGWRGAVYLNAVLAGTPADLTVSGELSVDDFRRYDIFSGETLRLSARCTAKYQLAGQRLSGIDCGVPQGGGEFRVRGSVYGLPGPPNYDLSISAKNVPMAELVRVAQHAKQGMPEDLTAGGELDAVFTLRKSATGSSWTGHGKTDAAALRSQVLGPELRLGTISFALTTPPPELARVRGVPIGPAEVPAAPRLYVAPFSVALGAANPATAQAALSRDEYRFELRGDAEIARLLRVSRAIGVGGAKFSASGNAKLDLHLTGSWVGFGPPSIRGRMQLRNVTAQIRQAGAPLQVRAASLVISAEQIRAQDVTASFPGRSTSFTGWLVLPRGCGPKPACPLRFDLHSPELSAEQLNRLFNPRMGRSLWSRFTSAESTGSLAQIRAEGRLTIDKLALGRFVATRASAQVQTGEGKLRLTRVAAELFGGKHRGEWRADFSGLQPVYAGSGTVERVAMGPLTELMADHWATGALSGNYRVMMAGWTEDELASSAEGVFDFDWRDGTLRRIALNGDAVPLRLKRFSGQLRLHDSRFEVATSRMETPAGIYAVSGSASLQRQLDLKLEREGAAGYTLSGTVEDPRVILLPASERQAALDK